MNIKETIKEALENNQLESQMSVIRMEAAKQGISDEELQRMVEAEKLQKKAVEAAKRNKYILWGICAVAIILEWILIFNAHPAEGEKSHLFLTLIINFVTLLIVVIGAAVFFRKHN